MKETLVLDAATLTDSPRDPAIASDRGVDLEAILQAWQAATERLRLTHETLSAEVGRLTDELQRKNRELARKNRLADLGQMASHVAHEVRNNLMPMTLYLSLLKRQVGSNSQAGCTMGKIEEGFGALQAMVSDLLNFTTDRELQCSGVHLRSLVQDICDSLTPQLSAQNVCVKTNIPVKQVLWVDRDMVRRAILNLVLNALDAMPAGGQLTIAFQRSASGDELKVIDTGEGLTEEAKNRLFEPFFTTKSNGTGLGLAIVYRITEAHDGKVLCSNNPNGGTEFTLRFPSYRMEVQS